MTENPYEVPRAPGMLKVTDDSRTGIWRDRNLLVMRIHDPQFPPRCVKTNKPVSEAPTRLDVDWIPNYGTWLLMFGAAGYIVAKSTFGKTISIQIPLSKEWLSRRRRTVKIGWGMIIGGICGLILSTVAYVFVMVSGADEASSQWIMFIIFGAPLVAIAGVVYLVACCGPIVTIRRMTDQHAWIGRVSTNFLESLPEWPG